MPIASETMEDEKQDHLMEEKENKVSYNGVQDISCCIDTSKYFTTDKIFESRNELRQWCLDVGKENKMVVVVHKSDNAKPNKSPRLLLGCERGGVYRRRIGCKGVADKGYRGTSSKKINCPFSLKGLYLCDDKWKLVIKCGFHNHDLVETLLGHSFAGRLNEDEKKIVLSLTKNGVNPHNILTTLKRKDVNNVSTKKTIYNARQQMRLNERGGLSIMQFTMQLLAENHYLYHYMENKQGNAVTQLFWCHPQSLELFKCFPNVVIVDCTYKTNKYKMPLFEIVGIASTGSTFNIAFVFMEYEKEYNYCWALECFKSVIGPEYEPKVFVTDKEQALINGIQKLFPKAQRLLCSWHISKNITAKCKKDFKKEDEWELFEKDWSKLISSFSEEEFDRNLTEFETIWSTNHISVVTYIRKNWLPLKSYFVSAWTKHVMHFGSATTQRVEGAHSTLKNYITSRNSSLPLVWQAMHSMLELQKCEIDAKLQYSLIKIDHRHNRDPLFDEIKGNISIYAMNIIWEEKKKCDEYRVVNPSKCGCLNKSVYGLPCACEIFRYNMKGSPIPLSSIHYHWKQLSSKLPECRDSGLDFNNDIVEGLSYVWRQYTEEEKRVLKRKVQDIINPSRMLLSEPPIKETNKGRPSKASDKKKKMSQSSTKRDLSAFEYAEIKSKKLVYTEDINNGLAFHTIPSFFHSFIYKLTNVPMDGHCGFHSCARGLGMSEFEGWRRIREDLLKELDMHREFYIHVWGGMVLEDHVRRISCLSLIADVEHWMETPTDLVLVANHYNQVVVLLAKSGCMTILPYFRGPQEKFATVCLVYIEEQRHYVHAELIVTSPLPPISPDWRHLCSPIALSWKSCLQVRLNQWSKLCQISQDQMVETVVLD